MSSPVVGIIGNHYLINDDYPVHASGDMNAWAVREVSDALPIIILPDQNLAPIDDIIETCDGFVFTGGRPNVHPKEYGEERTEAHGVMDEKRDGLALPLIRTLVERGQPLLAICRGFQELNVAMGGSLYPEIRDLPGRENHRMPAEGTLAEKFALRHEVNLTPGGKFAQLFGADTVQTNTLHGQGIKNPGPRIIIDGYAADGTPEAIFVSEAKGFALGVQWHPEYRASEDPVSTPLFAAFGEAVHEWCASR
jgi:putative glutamine amidotransferase